MPYYPPASGGTVADGSITGGPAGVGVKIAATTITNANIGAAAAIAMSKTALTTGGGLTLTTNNLTEDDMMTFSRAGVLAVSTGAVRYRFPFAVTILGVTAAVNTAPTGAALIADVRKNGTTIFSTTGNRPTIAISGTATTSEPTPDVTAIAAGDYLTVDIAQVGSTVAGADLSVFVRYRRT